MAIPEWYRLGIVAKNEANLDSVNIYQPLLATEADCNVRFQHFREHMDDVAAN